jgi:hypothetical protein
MIKEFIEKILKYATSENFSDLVKEILDHPFTKVIGSAVSVIIQNVISDLISDRMSDDGDDDDSTS